MGVRKGLTGALGQQLARGEPALALARKASCIVPFVTYRRVFFAYLNHRLCSCSPALFDYLSSCLG